MEAVRTEYESALPQLYKSGVAQEMADLGSHRPHCGSWALQGSYAIAGARLVDATGAAPVEDSVVIVRDGRIAAAGSRSAGHDPARHKSRWTQKAKPSCLVFGKCMFTFPASNSVRPCWVPG